jgi:hypothetical protein
MVPDLNIEMTNLLVGFCSVAVGFALIGLAALVVLAIEERPGRKRTFPHLHVSVAATKKPAPSVDEPHAAALDVSVAATNPAPSVDQPHAAA